MSKSFRCPLIAATVVLLAATGAQAALVTSLHSSGLTAGGTAQAAGGTDAHYVVVENGLASAVVLNNTSPYFANNAQSQWIWQQANGNPVNVDRTFRTTFDLTGFDFTTASITGLWGTDNIGLDILINGVSTGIALPGAVTTNFTQLHAFSIASGFQAGINTLDFMVRDVGGISAFRAELTGNAVAVPEPGSLALAALGLFAAAAGLSRKPS